MKIFVLKFWIVLIFFEKLWKQGRLSHFFTNYPDLQKKTSATLSNQRLFRWSDVFAKVGWTTFYRISLTSVKSSKKLGWIHLQMEHQIPQNLWKNEFLRICGKCGFHIFCTKFHKMCGKYSTKIYGNQDSICGKLNFTWFMESFQWNLVYQK